MEFDEMWHLAWVFGNRDTATFRRFCDFNFVLQNFQRLHLVIVTPAVRKFQSENRLVRRFLLGMDTVYDDDHIRHQFPQFPGDTFGVRIFDRAVERMIRAEQPVDELDDRRPGEPQKPLEDQIEYLRGFPFNDSFNNSRRLSRSWKFYKQDVPCPNEPAR
ncbi:MAG: hypothetical protein LBO82_00990 [Synergistaceae bacterium]|jgi:hypothetical protein|nr:hypothetical protein [Synergistaceae bacterium]